MAGKPIRIAILSDGKQARGDLKATEGSLQRLGGTAKKAGKAVALGLVVAGAAVVKLGIDSVKAASDSAQSIGASESIFKQYSDTVIKRSKKASEAVGLSANEYRELNNQLGAMLKNSGRPLREVAGLTDKLTRRAADLAAMHGGTTREAVEALSSALRGEMDPIERYGVTIKDATIEADLAARGLGDLKGAAKEQAKQQSRVSLIFKQSADAAGQFGKEADTLAGKSQRLGSEAENLKADFGRVLTPVLLKGADVIGKKVLPAVEDGIEQFAKWWPSIEKTAGSWGSDLLPVLKTGAEVLGDVVSIVKDIPEPLLKLAAGGAAAAYVMPKLSGGLSGAVTKAQDLGLYAGVLNAELRDSESRGKLAAGAMQKLGGVAKQAAGTAGLAALTVGFTSAATEGVSFGSAVQGIAGGAGIGMMFGPVGALIGAAAGGGLLALTGAFVGTKKSAEETRLELLRSEGFKDAKSDAEDLATALDTVVGKYGNVPRAAVQAGFTGKDGKLEADVKSLRSMGVSMDTITSAALGQADALSIVRRKLDDTAAARKIDAQNAMDAASDGAKKYNQGDLGRKEYEALVDLQDAAIKASNDATSSQERFGQRVTDNVGAIKASRVEVREMAAALGVTVKQFNAWPKQARTRVLADGLPQTSRDTLRLIGEYKGLQKFDRIKSVVSASGATFSMRQIEKLQQRYKLTQPQVSTLVKLVGDKAAKQKAREFAAEAKGASKAPAPVKLDANAKPALTVIKGAKKAARDYGMVNIPPPDFTTPTNKGVTPAKSAALSGGLGIGLNTAAGATAGVNAGAPAFSGAVRGMVSSGLAAGRDEAQIKSPSRKTTKDGRFIALGYRAGIDGGKKGVAKAMRGLVASVLKESGNGSKAIVGSVDRLLDKLGTGATSKKAKARLAKQRKVILKATADEAQALAKNAKQREALASGNYLPYLSKTSKLYKGMVAAGVKNLGDARSSLADAKQAFKDYSLAVKESVRSSASLAKQGEDVGFGSVDQLISRRQAGLANAQEWEQVIAQLTKAGLNQADLDELIQLGPEAGMGTAKALLNGGGAAIKEMNRISAQLEVVGKRMGDSTAKTMKQAGIDSALGLVKGLEADQKKLDAAAKKLAKKLVQAVKKELGIKSPSRVFKALGKHTTDGLIIGLDDYRVAKAGQALAAGLQGGFGTPDLRAVPAGGGRPGAQAQSISITVQVPPTADMASVGREIQKALDAAQAAGVRKKAA